MVRINLTTGLGYLKDKKTGRIVSKFELEPGDHEFDTTKYDIIEVSNKNELETLYVEPEISQEERIKTQLNQLREQILEALITGDTINLAPLRQQYIQLKQQIKSITTLKV